MGDGPGVAGANVRHYTDTVTQGLPGWMGANPEAGRHGEAVAYARGAIKRRIEGVLDLDLDLDTTQLPQTADPQQSPNAQKANHASFPCYRWEEICRCANHPTAMEASVRAHEYAGREANGLETRHAEFRARAYAKRDHEEVKGCL